VKKEKEKDYSEIRSSTAVFILRRGKTVSQQPPLLILQRKGKKKLGISRTAVRR